MPQKVEPIARHADLPDLARIESACELFRQSARFQLDQTAGKIEERLAIEPSLSFTAGVITALNWVLGQDYEGLFARNLDSLRQIGPKITA